MASRSGLCHRSNIYCPLPPWKLPALVFVLLCIGHPVNATAQIWPVVVSTNDSTVVASSLSKSLRQTIHAHDSTVLRARAADHHLRFVLHATQTSDANGSSIVRLRLVSNLVVRDRVKYRHIEREINSSTATCNFQFLHICKAGLKQRVEYAVRVANESTPLIKYIENGKWQ